MSILETYVHWANSVLAGIGSQVDVAALQGGQALCQLIDVLEPEARLLLKVKGSGDCTHLNFIGAALENMRGHGIKVKCQAQDIVGNNTKALLDVLWALILHYDIHSIDQSVQTRNVGEGKRKLLEWCQEVLETTFDPSDTLTFILCHDNWFVKLLEKATQNRLQQSQDKAPDIDVLLKDTESQYHIKSDIIKVKDIIEGTANEHTLMIYLSLLRRRMQAKKSEEGPSSGDNQRFMSSATEENQPHKVPLLETRPDVSSAASNNHKDQSFLKTGEIQVSGQSPTKMDFLPDNTLPDMESSSPTIRDRQVENLLEACADSIEVGRDIHNAHEKGSKTSSVNSEKSVYGYRSELQEDTHLAQTTHNTVSKYERKEPQQTTSTGLQLDTTHGSDKSGGRDTVQGSTFNTSDLALTEQQSERTHSHTNKKKPRERIIRITRPTDYIKQWEDTMIRLSSVSVVDEFGTPVSPLISHYNISYPRRSKSLDAYRSSYRNHTSTNLYSLPARSQSSDVLSTPTAYSPNDWIHSSSTDDSNHKGHSELATSQERSNSHQKDLKSIHGRLLHEASHANKNESRDPAIEETDQVRGHNYTTVPSVRHAHIPVSQVRHTNTYVSPVRHTNTSVSPVRHTNTSVSPVRHTKTTVSPVRHTNISVSPVRHTNSIVSPVRHTNTTVSPLRRVHHSVSPVRRIHSSVSPVRRIHTSVYPERHTHTSQSPVRHTLRIESPVRHAYPTESPVRHTYTPVSPVRRAYTRVSPVRYTYTSMGPVTNAYTPMSSVKHTNTTEFPVRHSVTRASPVRHVHTVVYPVTWPSGTPKTLVLSNQNEHITPRKRFISEPPLSIRGQNHLGNVFPGVDSTYSSNNTLEFLPVSDQLLSKTSMELEAQHMDNREDGRNYSPPSVRGVSRVPRREAWEKERRRRCRDVSVVESETKSHLQVIDSLLLEIDMLREKVEKLEPGVSRHRPVVPYESDAARNTIRPSASPSSRRHSKYNQTLLSDRISAPVSTGQERSLSCPLLKVSRRSLATRSLSRNGVSLRVSQSKDEQQKRDANLDLNSSKISLGTNSALDSRTYSSYGQPHRQQAEYNQVNHMVKQSIYSEYLSGSLEPRNIEKWRQLIFRNDLSRFDIIELKQAVARALAENDILLTKLNNARHEVQDKLKHTNGVLEDCRDHLARSQAENMELRVMLAQEKKRSESYQRQVTDLENSMMQVKNDNKQLEHELGHTSMLLDDSLAKIKPEVNALKAENMKLVSRLSVIEDENDDLRDEVLTLNHKQAKAVDTMDGLRKCLARARQERQEMYDELETFKQKEHKNKIREIIKHYQEKGIQDEWEKEQYQLGEKERYDFSHSGSHVIEDSSHLTSGNNLPQRLSMSPIRDRQRGHRHCQDREVYANRKEYMTYRDHSPLAEGRSTSLPNYSHPVSADKAFLYPDLQERKQCKRKKKQLAGADIQSSQGRLHRTRSPQRYISPQDGSHTITHGQIVDNSLNPNYSTSSAIHYGLNRSVATSEASTYPHSAYTPHTNTVDNRKDRKEAELRSGSPSWMKDGNQDIQYRSLDKMTFGYCTSPTRGHSSPRRRHSSPRRCHSSPTRCNSSSTRRPLRTNKEAGERARKLQEFHQEDHMITPMSRNHWRKSWIDKRSGSDAEDTGINSSMSSWSSCDRLYLRKQTPSLTPQQRQYADQLVQKYTGQISHKQPA